MATLNTPVEVPVNVGVRLDPKKTWVPLSLVITIGIAVSGYLWNGVTTRLEIMDNRLAMIERTVLLMEERGSDRFTGADARTAFERLGRMNPGMNVPSINDLLGDQR